MDSFKYAVLVFFAVTYILIMIFKKKKLLITFTTAFVFVSLGILFPDKIFPIPEDMSASADPARIRLYPLLFAVIEAVNWNVIMVYSGSMILSAMLSWSRLPQVIAESLVRKTTNPGFAVALFLGLTGILSAFSSNLAVFLMMAPVAVAISSRMKISSVCFVMGVAFVSNLGGALALVGDSASIIFADSVAFGMKDFFIHNGKFSVFFAVLASLAAGCIFFYILYFKSQKTEAPEIVADSVDDRKFCIFPSFLMVTLLAGIPAIESLKLRIDFLPGLFVLSLAMISVFWFRIVKRNSSEKMHALFEDVNLSSAVYLVFVFIVMGTLCQSGIFDFLIDFLAMFMKKSPAASFAAIIFFSVILSAFVDNSACLMLILPFIGKASEAASINNHLFMAAVFVGTCLGCNLLPLGAGVNVAAINLLDQNGYRLKITGWLKTSVIFTILTVTVAALFVWWEFK